MHDVDPKQPSTYCGWGEGHINKLIRSIINNKSSELIHPETFNYEEIVVDDSFFQICKKNRVKVKSDLLSDLSILCRTSPKNILVIETQKVVHDNKGQTFFRFHHMHTIGRQTNYSRYVLDNIPIRNPWASRSPGIFYQLTVAKTVDRKNINKRQAQEKLNSAFANLINEYDFIFDLANSRVYKRTICLKLKDTLGRLQHLQEAILFDYTAVQSALAKYLDHKNIQLNFDPSLARIEFYDVTVRKYLNLIKDAKYAFGIKYHPYAADQSHLLIRYKYFAHEFTFLVHMRSLLEFIKFSNTSIETVICHHGIDLDGDRLKEYYITFTKNRVVGSPVLHLDQPCGRTKITTDL